MLTKIFLFLNGMSQKRVPEYSLNGTRSVWDYLGAKQDKNEPDGERVIRIFPDRTSKFSFRKR